MTEPDQADEAPLIVDSDGDHHSDITDTTAGSFDDLGLRSELLSTLERLGYTSPTPIQTEAIPPLLTGADLLGQAATGTGKTAAFALPVLDGIDPGDPAVPTALVLVPTRELAIQVSEAIFSYGKSQGVRVVPVYGGQPIVGQLQVLKRGVHVVVATPGRGLDHIKRRSLKLDDISTVVLDEADEMLDMGFAEDIEAILDATPDDRQTVLFSATMPPRINSIAKRYQRDPIRIQIRSEDSATEKALIEQRVYFVARFHKAAALGRILDIESPQSTLVFCRTRADVDDLTETMNARGYRAEALHGGMDQTQRDRVMGRLRDGTASLLVATDVAARGLDVNTLTHVVNYDLPTAAESYVHRIGRVGRAGRRGVAITLADPRQKHLLRNVERLTKTSIEVSKVPSVEALRNRQIELTVAAVRDALASEDLDDHNPVLHDLAGDDGLRNIALAAIKLVHDSMHSNAHEIEIPEAFDKKKNNKFEKKNRGPKGTGSRDGGHHKGGKGGRPAHGDEKTGMIYVGLGRKAGIRPGDLVGAIANETHLSGRQIGPIRIDDKFSVVGVPEDAVDQVIAAIEASSIKGKKARSRRYVN